MEMINWNRIKGTPWYLVASSFPFRRKNFERKRSHVSQLKGQTRGTATESFVVARLLFVYTIRRAERRVWKAFQKALNSQCVLSTSWHRLHALTYLYVIPFTCVSRS